MDFIRQSAFHDGCGDAGRLILDFSLMQPGNIGLREGVLEAFLDNRGIAVEKVNLLDAGLTYHLAGGFCFPVILISGLD